MKNEYPYVIHISKPNKKCLQCENIKFCGSCAASRYAETGDINGLPDMLAKMQQSFNI